MLDSGLGLAWDAIAPDVRGVVGGTWSGRWGACRVLVMFTLMGSFKNHTFASQSQWPGHAVGINHEPGGGSEPSQQDAPGLWRWWQSIEIWGSKRSQLSKGLAWGEKMENRYKTNFYQSIKICKSRWTNFYQSIKKCQIGRTNFYRLIKIC